VKGGGVLATHSSPRCVRKRVPHNHATGLHCRRQMKAWRPEFHVARPRGRHPSGPQSYRKRALNGLITTYSRMQQVVHAWLLGLMEPSSMWAMSIVESSNFFRSSSVATLQISPKSCKKSPASNTLVPR